MDSVALSFFFFQQLGMTLGVGSSTFAVMFYLLALQDGVVDASERRFMRAVFAVLRIGLGLIIASGIAITIAHFLAGESAILLKPTYLFKWVLLAVIVVNGYLMTKRLVPTRIGGVIAGGSWYALFVVHTLAYELSWLYLSIGYVLWLALFTAAFVGLKRLSLELYKKEGSAAPKPAAPPPPVHFTLTNASANAPRASQ